MSSVRIVVTKIPYFADRLDQVPPFSYFVALLLSADVVSPAQILISESKPHSIRVSWSPILESVAAYQVMYGPLNDNLVQLQEVDGRLNSTVLENLLANTSYLVTVSAIYKSGKEKALSAKACTREGEQEKKEGGREGRCQGDLRADQLLR